MNTQASQKYPLLRARLTRAWDRHYFRFHTAAQLHVGFVIISWRMPDQGEI